VNLLPSLIKPNPQQNKRAVSDRIGPERAQGVLTMTQSPGHQKWPEHKVEEKPLKKRIQVAVGDQLVADTTAAVEVDEDNHPPRFYIPRADVNMGLLQPSNTRTRCPFKGEAHYFDLGLEGRIVADAAWTYENPYEEHEDLKDLIAFHDDKPGIEVRQDGG
jgi:uncharacterized protein (DUF427 family)